MSGAPQPDERKGLVGAGADLERRYPIALALYGFLGVLVWFTMGPGKIYVMGRAVELRWVPLLVIGSFALRTVLARQAERIRRGGDEGEGSAPRS
jgi:hypothetical protein